MSRVPSVGRFASRWRGGNVRAGRVGVGSVQDPDRAMSAFRTCAPQHNAGRRLLLSVSVLWLGLAACSRGGSGDAPPAPGSWSVVVDTRAGTPEQLQARLVGVALEDANGAPTANLLREDAELTIADPAGRPCAVELIDPPAGHYTAVRLLFAPDSCRLVDRNGDPHAVRLTSIDPRAEFAAPLVLPSPQHSMLLLSHPRPVAIRDQGGILVWTPDFVRSAPGPIPFDRLDFEVAAVDRDAGRISAWLRPPSKPRPVTVSFASDASFSQRQAHQQLTRSEFMHRVGVGDFLRGSGTIDSSMQVVLQVVELHQRAWRNRANSVFGWIKQMTGRESFELQIVVVHEGSADPGLVRVDASDAHLRRAHEPQRKRGMDELRAGVWVEVEWRGEAKLDPIPAKEITIDDFGGRCLGPAVAGSIELVGVAERVVVVVPVPGIPLLVGKRPVDRAELVLAPDAVLVRDDDERERIELTELRSGDRVKAIGRVQQDGRVLVDWMQVRRLE